VKESKPDLTKEEKTKQEVADRYSEATSPETLSDLEQEEKIADSNSDDVSNEAQVPFPDGTPDPINNLGSSKREGPSER